MVAGAGRTGALIVTDVPPDAGKSIVNVPL
jgi:hypothetical protein